MVWDMTSVHDIGKSDWDVNWKSHWKMTSAQIGSPRYLEIGCGVNGSHFGRWPPSTYWKLDVHLIGRHSRRWLRSTRGELLCAHERAVDDEITECCMCWVPKSKRGGSVDWIRMIKSERGKDKAEYSDWWSPKSRSTISIIEASRGNPALMKTFQSLDRGLAGLDYKLDHHFTYSWQFNPANRQYIEIFS